MSAEGQPRVKTVKTLTSGDWNYVVHVVLPALEQGGQYEWIIIRFPYRRDEVAYAAIGLDVAWGLEDSYESAARRALEALQEFTGRE